MTRLSHNYLTKASFIFCLSSGKCGRQIYQATGQSGTIQSPGYPHSYSPVQTCIWRMSVNTGFRVHIHFDPLFDVTRTPACRDEYVLISTRRQRFNDFNIVRNRKDSVAFCGNQKPSNVTSPANEMWIRFKSKSGGRRGFRAWYGAEGELEPRTHYTEEPRFNEVPRDFKKAGLENIVRYTEHFLI